MTDSMQYVLFGPLAHITNQEEFMIYRNAAVSVKFLEVFEDDEGGKLKWERTDRGLAGELEVSAVINIGEVVFPEYPVYLRVIEPLDCPGWMISILSLGGTTDEFPALRGDSTINGERVKRLAVKLFGEGTLGRHIV